MERFRDGVPAADRDGLLPAAYSRLLHDPHPEVRRQAAQDWCAWEDVHVSLAPDAEPCLSVADPAYQLCVARLVTHYRANNHFLTEGQLRRDAGRLAGISRVMVHGRFDVRGLWTSPGTCTGPGRTASWSSWTTPGTARAA